MCVCLYILGKYSVTELHQDALLFIDKISFAGWGSFEFSMYLRLLSNLWPLFVHLQSIGIICMHHHSWLLYYLWPDVCRIGHWLCYLTLWTLSISFLLIFHYNLSPYKCLIDIYLLIHYRWELRLLSNIDLVNIFYMLPIKHKTKADIYGVVPEITIMINKIMRVIVLFTLLFLC